MFTDLSKWNELNPHNFELYLIYYHTFIKIGLLGIFILTWTWSGNSSSNIYFSFISYFFFYLFKETLELFSTSSRTIPNKEVADFYSLAYFLTVFSRMNIIEDTRIFPSSQFNWYVFLKETRAIQWSRRGRIFYIQFFCFWAITI